MTTEPRLRFARPLGATLDSMRKHVHETELPRLGDTILIWVNQGDLWQLAFNGVQVQEYKNPDR